MPILIDGHNLIGAMRDIHLGDPDDEEQLVEQLSRLPGSLRKGMTVFFDAGGGFQLGAVHRQGGVRVEYARSGRSADELIIERVSIDPNPAGLIVVTSDQRVSRMSRMYGARVVSAREFIQKNLRFPAGASSAKDGLKPAREPEIDKLEQLFIQRELKRQQLKKTRKPPKKP
jgi:uncharacterized protein